MKFLRQRNIYIALTHNIYNDNIIRINNDNFNCNFNQMSYLFDYLYNINYFKLC